VKCAAFDEHDVVVAFSKFTFGGFMMNSEQKQAVAVFRFGVIADLVGSVRLLHGEREALLRQKCERMWHIPFSARTRLGRSTILRWVSLYEESGGRLESLLPSGRSDCGGIRALDEELTLAILKFREDHRSLGVPQFLTQLRSQGIITPGKKIATSTLYRLLHSHALVHAPEQTPGALDRRKFEAELPNDLWQCDVMHGPHFSVGGKQRKSYLIAFIDDHSRLIPYASFFLSEGVASFLQAFESALIRRGLPRRLYVDNGAAFRSRQLEYSAATLGIALIHAKPYQPQGKGKIERFFKTVRSQLLPTLEATTFDDANSALSKWIEENYHRRKHRSTGQSPFERFSAQMHCLRQPPENLRDAFRKVIHRRVNRDRSVVIDKRLFEAPVALIGKRIELLYHEHEPLCVEARFAGQSQGTITPIDLHVNSRVKRDRNSQIELCNTPKVPETLELTPPPTGQLWEA
jgi:putative transposase